MSRVQRVDSDEGLGLEGFRAARQEDGISLDQLSQAFASMLGQGDDPYAPAEPQEPESHEELILAEESTDSEADDGCEISPRTIVEAMFFVGSPDNRPLTSQEIASLMRGVRPSEVDDIVRDLNRMYVAAGCPYRIQADGAGYRMMLASEFSPVREKFYGKIRQATLSPAAIEVLAMVAYNQPLSADDVNKLRGKPSGPLLSQLVRRQLLRIERGDEKPRIALYYTTPRFLQVFHLDSLDDLPRGQEDLDRQ